LSGETSQLRSHLHILHGVHWVAGGRRRPEANFKPHWEVTCLTRRWMRLITLFPCLRKNFDEEFCKNLCWWCGWWWDWLLCSHALEFFLWRLLQNLCWWCGCKHHPTIAIPISKVSSHGQICSNLVANTGNLGLVPGPLDYGARFFIFSYYPHSPTIGNILNKRICIVNWSHFGPLCSQWMFPR
jgi:hypothetical protein